MGKEHQKRVLAALMAASIAIPTPVLAASPADFSDCLLYTSDAADEL